MKFNFLGGAMEIGGSSILVHLQGKNLLLDAGIRQSSGKDPLPNFRTIQDQGGLDAILISHAHMDHIGSLPLISKEYPVAKIYMTHMTKDLMRVLLFDSLKIMNRREEEIPYYAERDVFNMLERCTALHYDQPFELLEEMKLTLYPAGHIAGASCCYVQSKEGAVFYSGDFSSFGQKSIEGIRIPKLRPDVAIVETTYGDRLHANRQTEEAALIAVVTECIANNGKMIIPAFALGRAQEVILLLKSAMNKGLLPKTKIYVDGMVRDINRAYLQNPLYLKNTLGQRILKGISPFYDEQIIAVKPTDDREALLKQAGAAIIISSSGMLTGGPSMLYAEKIAPLENGYIIITGYQDEEAPGRQLTELLEQPATEERCLQINGKTIPLKCTIKKIGLSAHGDKNEIKGLLDKLTPKNVFLVHGNETVIKRLGQELSQDLRSRIFLPECGQEVALSIYAPRKQLNKIFPYTLQKSTVFSANDNVELWNYVKEHYAGKLFTIFELHYIWSGCKSLALADLEQAAVEFQQQLLSLPYFSLDTKRLFLFKARSGEEIAADLKPKEWTVQEIEQEITEQFTAFAYKKISFIVLEKKVILNFDFPHVIGSTMGEKAAAFTEKTGWRIEINDKINNSAALFLLHSWFSSNIKKTSFFTENHCVTLALYQPVQNPEKFVQDFKKITGWSLQLDKNAPLPTTAGAMREQQDSTGYYSPGQEQPAEQNMAFACIDASFSDQQHRPYKKSIKSNGQGKYLELAFLTPMLGHQYSDLLQKIACEIGWHLKIAESINQNEIFNITKMICMQHDLALQKNPSYLPATKQLELKLKDDAMVPESVCQLIQKKTGLIVKTN